VKFELIDRYFRALGNVHAAPMLCSGLATERCDLAHRLRRTISSP
jgi:hypothetical protein